MNHPAFLTDKGLLSAVGERIAAIRISRNLTQQELAERSGLGLRTVQRLENGAASTQLSGFLMVCHVLGMLEHLDLLLPEPPASPADERRLKGRKRQRVRKKKNRSSSVF